MKMDFTFAVAILVLSTIALTCKAQSTGVFVNGQEMSASDLSQLEQTTGATVTPGQYWYDGVAGAYGCMGGPTKGSAPPGLQAAPLSATASNGNTGVFVNGRELPNQDLTLLQQAIKATIPPGRYWLKSDGSYGTEGNPTPTGTLATSGGSGGGGSDGCTTTNSGTHVCSGDGFTSVGGEDSSGHYWDASTSTGRKLSAAQGRPYNIAGKKLLQQTVSCPATGSTPSSPVTSSPPASPGSPSWPGPSGLPGSPSAPVSGGAQSAAGGGSTAGGVLAGHGNNGNNGNSGARATAGIVAVLHAALCCVIVVQQLVF